MCCIPGLFFFNRSLWLCSFQSDTWPRTAGSCGRGRRSADPASWRVRAPTAWGADRPPPDSSRTGAVPISVPAWSAPGGLPRALGFESLRTYDQEKPRPNGRGFSWLKIAILTKQGLSLDLEKASSIALSLIWSPGIFHS